MTDPAMPRQMPPAVERAPREVLAWRARPAPIDLYMAIRDVLEGEQVSASAVTAQASGGLGVNELYERGRAAGERLVAIGQGVQGFDGEPLANTRAWIDGILDVVELHGRLVREIRADHNTFFTLVSSDQASGLAAAPTNLYRDVRLVEVPVFFPRTRVEVELAPRG